MAKQQKNPVSDAQIAQEAGKAVAFSFRHNRNIEFHFQKVTLRYQSFHQCTN